MRPTDRPTVTSTVVLRGSHATAISATLDGTDPLIRVGDMTVIFLSSDPGQRRVIAALAEAVRDVQDATRDLSEQEPPKAGTLPAWLFDGQDLFVLFLADGDRLHAPEYRRRINVNHDDDAVWSGSWSYEEIVRESRGRIDVYGPLVTL